MPRGNLAVCVDKVETHAIGQFHDLEGSETTRPGQPQYFRHELRRRAAVPGVDNGVVQLYRHDGYFAQLPNPTSCLTGRGSEYIPTRCCGRTLAFTAVPDPVRNQPDAPGPSATSNVERSGRSGLWAPDRNRSDRRQHSGRRRITDGFGSSWHCRRRCEMSQVHARPARLVFSELAARQWPISPTPACRTRRRRPGSGTEAPGLCSVRCPRPSPRGRSLSSRTRRPSGPWPPRGSGSRP